MAWQIFRSAIQTWLIDDRVRLPWTGQRFSSFDFDEETNGVIRLENLSNEGQIEPQKSISILTQRRTDEERHLVRVIQVIDNRAVVFLSPAKLCLWRDVQHQMMLALIAETFHLIYNQNKR